jgi:cell division protein FtsL
MPQTARRGHARRAPMPRHGRRVSGPVARAVPAAPSVAVPRRRAQTGAFERLRALPEHRLVDRLLRSRAWIWLIAIMLGGIVTMQVSLLKLNAGISKNVETASTLERVNADLETEVAKLSSGERIQHTAAEEDMVTPSAGDIGFLHARPGTDPRLAAQRMQKPSDEAEEVMANGGHSLTAPAIAADPAAAPVATTAVATAATPVATVVPPAPTPTPTPAPTVDPAATSPAG